MTYLEKRVKSESEECNIASGVLALTISTVIVKIIGLIYKIPMLTLLGSEGMGYFNSAYEIYMLFGIVGTAGVPVAMSVMISRSRCRADGGEGRIFSLSRFLFLFLGISLLGVMLFSAPLSRYLFGSDGVIFCIIAISPTVLFICLSSVYRGFFQGIGRMRETAISQVIEAALKLILGLAFARLAIWHGLSLPMVAAAGVLGLTLGSFFSLLYLAVSKRIYDKRIGGAGRWGAAATKKSANKWRAVAVKECNAPTERCAVAVKECDTPTERCAVAADGCVMAERCRKRANLSGTAESGRSILSLLVRTAIPISLSALVMNLTKIIDMTVILRRLQDIGYTSGEAFSVYGGYTTLVLPLFSLAPALISSVSLPLVPALARLVAREDGEGQRTVVADSTKTAMIVAMPISLGLSFFSREILTLIFGREQSAIALATPLLSLLSLAIPLSCLITIESAVLQAYMKTALPMVSVLCGSVLKIILGYILVGSPEVNILGAPISTIACDLLINALNFFFISKRLPRGVPLGNIIKPFLAAFISVCGSRLLYSALAVRFDVSAMLTLAVIGFCALIYLPVSLLIGAIEIDDVRRILRR